MRPLPARLAARLAAALAAMLSLAACDDPYPLAPDLAATGAGARYPALVPAEQIRAQVPPVGARPETTVEAVGTRAARLRARAARLRGAVIDPETETRMRRGVDG